MIFPKIYSKTFSPIISLIFSLEKKRKYQLFFLTFLMVLSALSEVFSLASFIPFITSLSNPEKLLSLNFINQINFFSNYSQQNLIIIYTFIFAVSIISAGILRIITSSLIYKITAIIGTDIMGKCLDLLYNQPYSKFIIRNSSDIVHLSVVQVNDAVYVILKVLQLIASSILFVALISTMFFINFHLTLLAIIVFVSVYIFIVLKFKSKIYNYSREIDEIKKWQIRLLTEMNGSIRDVIFNNSRNKFLSIFLSKDREMRNNVSMSYFLNSFPKPVIESLAIFLFAIFGAYLYTTSSNQLVIPVVGSLALASQKLIPSLQSIYDAWSQIKLYIAGAKVVSHTLSIPKYSYKTTSNKFTNWEKIIFSEVFFSHENSKKKIIEDISLVINRGDTIGIQGSTGSGKSTFADLLSGLLKPTKGSIKASDANNNHRTIFNDHYWFKEISYVPQKIFLLDNTIANNIAFNFKNDLIDYDLVRKVSKLARIDEFILSLDDGYQTNVGEQGITLSGGQQQRIAIARALYKKSSILIFDEATSALDYKTEDLIMESVSYLSKIEELTIIIIAHRLNTLDQCDCIYKIENGKIKTN